MSLDNKLQRILCATDFSASATVALDWATSLATHEGAELHLVHAWQPPDMVMPGGGIAPIGDLAASIERETSAELERLGAGRTIKSQKIVRGAADVEIVAHATAIGADLLVVGTHGRTGLSHVLLGSVAERVIRTSPAPVATIPAGWGARARAPKQFRRILAPSDLSATSEGAVATLLAFAERQGAEIDLLHVLDLPAYAIRQDDVFSEMERAVRRDLDELAGRHRHLSTGLHTHVRVGRAADTIVALADELDVDLLALPTHGRTGVERFFLGSVAERIARTAKRPVLTLRGGNHS